MIVKHITEANINLRKSYALINSYKICKQPTKAQRKSKHSLSLLHLKFYFTVHLMV